jgi:hypothetical protein
MRGLEGFWGGNLGGDVKDGLSIFEKSQGQFYVFLLISQNVFLEIYN